MPPADDTKTYWAAKSGLDLADEAFRRVKKFYQDLPKSPMYERWVKAYRTFYGLAGDGDPFDVSATGTAGRKANRTAVRINHAGNLARHAMGIVSQTVPEFEPVPTNTDYKSLTQVGFCRKLLAYNMDVKGVASHLYDTALSGVIFGAGKLVPEWDPHAGAKLDQPDPALPSRKRTGDLAFRVFTPLDVVQNRFRYDQEHDWFITRRWMNRWDLAARYPAQAEDILALPTGRNMLASTNSVDTERENLREEIDDLVPLYTLFHRQSDAMPDGKIAQFASEDILFYEGPLPYDEVPSVDICPGKMLRTPYGDSSFHHVLSLQDVRDHIMSSVASNIIAHARQIVMIPEGSDWDVAELGELAFLRFDPGPDGKLKPEGLSLLAPNGESLRFAELLVKEAETITGIPATSRGSPDANVQSGSFGALVAQQALTYAGAFQYSFQQAVAKTGTLIVKAYKRFADVPMLVELAGSAGAYQVEQFTRDKLSNIHRVAVKSGNPAARTPQFALAAAESLLAKGVIKTTREFVNMARGGAVDTMVEGPEAEALNIRRENELLADGSPGGVPAAIPPVVAIDRHMEHIDAHSERLGDPSVRQNPEAVTRFTTHIQWHIDALRTIDPALLQMRGQTPLPPIPGMPAMSGAGANAPQPNAGAPGEEGMPGEQPGTDPAAPPPHPVGQPPQLPQMPVNPSNGERVAALPGTPARA